MLTEYALTPHLFDDLHNADEPQWLERLRAFGLRLLPPGSARICNTVVSDLCNGSWYTNAFLPLLKDLEKRQNQDQTTRLPALDLLKTLRPRLADRLVERPFSSDSLPDTEEQWAIEAESSGERLGLPIHRLVGSQKLVPGQGRHTLSQTQDEAFWDSVSAAPTVPADLTQQLAVLRRMCSFYSFLAFASPQLVAEGSGKDLTFAIGLAKRAFHWHRDFSPLQRIDLHVKGDTGSDAARTRQAEAILDRVKTELGPATERVRVWLWRNVKERRLLVGHSDGSNAHPRVVWGVAMTHVARPGSDDPKRDHHTFSVLERQATSRLTSDYYGTTNQPYPGSPWVRQTSNK